MNHLATPLQPALRALQYASLRHRFLEVLATLIILAGVHIAAAPPLALTLALGLAALIAISVRHHLTRITPATFLQRLNRSQPDLEYSAAVLLVDPATLSPMANLQRNRIANRPVDRAALLEPFQLRHKLPLLAVSIVLAALIAFSPALINQAETVTARNTQAKVSATSAPVLIESQIHIQPPSYTQLAATTQSELSVEAVEGSQLSWQLRFEPKPQAVTLEFGDDQSLDLTLTDDVAGGQHTLDRAALYTLAVTDQQGRVNRSEFFKLIARPDLSPDIRFIAPDKERTLLDPAIYDAVHIEALARDDFGLSRADLRLTLARGSGESVKFEYRTLELPDPKQTEDGAIYETDLVFTELNVAAGDEIYVQLDVFDNREPIPNRTRSATMIIVLSGEPDPPIADMAGLAVDRLPEYFRSQRQIIIDTEKLIEDRPNITDTAFMARSNNLAIDQKILRIRYGQFLGEEFVTNMAPGETHHPGHNHGEYDDTQDQKPNNDDAQADQTSQETQENQDTYDNYSGHAHHNHRHGRHRVRIPGSDERISEIDLEELAHNHDEDEPTFDETPQEFLRITENPLLTEYLHLHDNEMSGFLPQAVAEQLRKCLAEMWDSEAHLRLSEPKKALPYQFRALQLLQEIRRADRVYVRRTEIDLPPLEPAKLRFTGELDDIDTIRAASLTPEQQNPLRTLLGQLSSNQMDPALLDQARILLTERAIQAPDRYLDSLNALERLRREATPDHRAAARAQLWALLPPPEREPHRQSGGDDLMLDYRRLLEEP